MKELENVDIVGLDDFENLKYLTLCSLLSFLLDSDDDLYITKAKDYANQAILKARKLEIKRTLPAFIYAVTSLYDEKPDADILTHNFFRYSILAELDDDLIPLLFSIYLDRFQKRIMLNRAFSPNQLTDISEIINEDSIKKFYCILTPMMVFRYFTLIKIEQQRILSIT